MDCTFTFKSRYSKNQSRDCLQKKKNQVLKMQQKNLEYQKKYCLRTSNYIPNTIIPFV